MPSPAWVTDYRIKNEIPIERHPLDLARENLKLQFEIAERQRLQEELEAAKDQLENIFNNVIPICVTSLDCEILQANNAYKPFSALRPCLTAA